MTRSIVWGCVIAALALSASPRAFTQEAEFIAVVGGEERYARAAVVMLQDTRYVSLSRLTEQLGGGATILPTRAKIDYQGATAWVQFNDTRINALSLFSLAQPALRHEGDVYVALEDVADFFTKAFRIGIELREVREAPVPEPAPELAGPTPELAELGPLPEREPEQTPQAGQQAVAPTHDIEVVVIDAGHGGSDTGLEASAGLWEKNLSLGFAQALGSAITARTNLKVAYTRPEDSNLTLPQRAVRTTDANGDLLISIHVGGALSNVPSGTAFFVNPSSIVGNRLTGRGYVTDAAPRGPVDYSGQSRGLADAMATALRGAEVPVLGVYETPCKVLGTVSAPGVLIEAGFVTNPGDASQLNSDEYAARWATALAEGLATHFGMGAANEGPAPSE